jgi:hypothetical protein
VTLKGSTKLSVDEADLDFQDPRFNLAAWVPGHEGAEGTEFT